MKSEETDHYSPILIRFINIIDYMIFIKSYLVIQETKLKLNQKYIYFQLIYSTIHNRIRIIDNKEISMILENFN